MNFRDIIREKIIIGDGAMGTRIYQKGVPLGSCYEELNETNPYLIKKIHQEYIEAGAELIETNTFQANRISLKKFNLQDKVKEFNEAGVKIVLELKKISKSQLFIAGSVGPLSSLKETELSDEEIKNVFKEQLQVLLNSGVDLIILETFTNISEIEIAVKIAKELTDKPVIAQMSYFKKLNLKLPEVVSRLDKAGADIIGVNCTRGPHYALEVVKELSTYTKKPISAFPNAGLPQYVDGRYMYLTTPEYFLAKIREMIKAGANIVGGCCGTDAAHIKLIADKLKSASPVPRKIYKTARFVIKKAAVPVEAKAARLKDKNISSVIVEVDPPRNLDAERTFRLVRKLQKARVDAITIGDNPLAVVRMGNLSFAKKIEDMGIPTIVHMSCRDKNLIALQSTIMEAHWLGIKSLLVITGDPAKVGDQPEASSVYDLNSFDLIKLIKGFNDGVSFAGDPMKERTRFVLGCAFNPNKRRADDELRRLEKKIEAGADMALTQPCYDKKSIELAFTQIEKRFPKLPVYLGVLPPVSFKNAQFLANEVPGISIPDSFLKMMESIPHEKQAEASSEYIAELISFSGNFTKKFYFILPLKLSVLLNLIEQVRADILRPK